MARGYPFSVLAVDEWYSLAEHVALVLIFPGDYPNKPWMFSVAFFYSSCCLSNRILPALTCFASQCYYIIFSDGRDPDGL